MVTDFISYNPPFFLGKVSAGFPSPADDFIKKTIDLNEVMILHASATQIITMPSDELISLGIFSGDYLLMDKAIKPKHGNIVTCHHEGNVLIGKWDKRKQQVNHQKLDEDSIIIGVITWAVRRL